MTVMIDTNFASLLFRTIRQCLSKTPKGGLKGQKNLDWYSSKFATELPNQKLRQAQA